VEPTAVSPEKGAVNPDAKQTLGERVVLTALVPSALALAWLVSKAQWYWSHNPEMRFGWIVLLLSAFIIWDQWKNRPSPKWTFGWPVLVFALIGMFLLFIVQIYAAAFGTMPALILGLSLGVFAICAANIHYVFGWAGIRFFAFPVLFLLIALPLPSAIQNPVVGGLQSLVTRVNVEILNLLGIPAERAGSLIRLPNGTVGINEACSGIRSLQSTMMATLFIGYLTLKRRSLQLALFLSGVGLAVFGNVVRSLYLSITANARGLQAAEKVHDSASWSILIFTVMGVALAAWLIARFEKRVNEAAS